MKALGKAATPMRRQRNRRSFAFAALVFGSRCRLTGGPHLAHCESRVRQGDAVENIVSFSHDIGAAFAVLGEHARGFLRGLFTQDSAREVPLGRVQEPKA